MTTDPTELKKSSIKDSQKFLTQPDSDTLMLVAIPVDHQVVCMATIT